MKKIVFAIFTLAAFALVGCEKKGANIMDIDADQLDNNTEKCWQYTLEYENGTSLTAHLWGTEQYAVKSIQTSVKLSQLTGVEVTATYKATSARDSDSCK